MDAQRLFWPEGFNHGEWGLRKHSSRSLPMADIRETCSVCNSSFSVVFRYQMEERDGGFVFFCSQPCLEESQVGGGEDGASAVCCEACAKRFRVALASQVFYTAGKRRYACSMPCRAQLTPESQGVPLGDIAQQAA